MKIVDKHISNDGTSKYLVEFDDSSRVECVALFHKRTLTACISSQVGCAIGCRFCATGAQGFTRNLSVSEIVGQLSLMEQDIDAKFTNVVFMGMGETLLNYDNVVSAVRSINDSGITWKRITVSTVGIPDRIRSLWADCKCRLALSLHAPDENLRKSLIPNARPLSDIMSACRAYQSTKHNPLMIEYVLIREVNDSDVHAEGLCSLLSGLPHVMVNLIVLNPVYGSGFMPSARADAFKKTLVDHGFKTIIRTPKGADIDAACGLLKNKA